MVQYLVLLMCKLKCMAMNKDIQDKIEGNESPWHSTNSGQNVTDRDTGAVARDGISSSTHPILVIRALIKSIQRCTS